jgi:uncharacterized damage-inducible protein DinB
MSQFVRTVRGLLAYTIWADRAMLKALKGVRDEDLTRETGGSFGTVLGTMAHILGAEQLWLSRYLGVPLDRLPGPEDYPSLAALEASFLDFWPQLEFFLASLLSEQLEQSFLWVNTRGETNSAPFRQVLLHFVNHATYHRGQVANLLRQLGYEPPHTDLAYYPGEI